MILGRTIDVITRHASHRARPAMWPGGRTAHCLRTEEDVMAQPGPSRAHVAGRRTAVVLLPAAPARTLRIRSLDHTTPATGGISFPLPCPLTRPAAVGLPSAPARLPGRRPAGVTTVHGMRGATRQSDARRLS